LAVAVVWKGTEKKNAYIDTVEHVEPRLGARATSAVAALANVDAEGVVGAVVRAQRGGEARAAAHAERVPAPADAAGVALRRAGFGFGADDDLVALAAVVRAAAVVAEGGGAGYGPPCSWRRSPPRGAA
jgi:hypothetical protein